MSLLYFGTWMASYIGGSLGGQVLSEFTGWSALCPRRTSLVATARCL